MKFLNAMRLAIGLVNIAEELVPASGKGKEKLAFVMSATAAAYLQQAELRAAWKDPAALAAAVARAVPIIVSVKNAAGIFRSPLPNNLK